MLVLKTLNFKGKLSDDENSNAVVMIFCSLSLRENEGTPRFLLACVRNYRLILPFVSRDQFYSISAEVNLIISEL